VAADTISRADPVSRTFQSIACIIDGLMLQSTSAKPMPLGHEVAAWYFWYAVRHLSLNIWNTNAGRKMEWLVGIMGIGFPHISPTSLARRIEGGTVYVDGGARRPPATWLPVKIALDGHSGRSTRRWSCLAVSERAVRLRSAVVCMPARQKSAEVRRVCAQQAPHGEC